MWSSQGGCGWSHPVRESTTSCRVKPVCASLTYPPTHLQPPVARREQNTPSRPSPLLVTRYAEQQQQQQQLQELRNPVDPAGSPPPRPPFPSLPPSLPAPRDSCDTSIKNQGNIRENKQATHSSLDTVPSCVVLLFLSFTRGARVNRHTLTHSLTQRSVPQSMFHREEGRFFFSALFPTDRGDDRVSGVAAQRGSNTKWGEWRSGEEEKGERRRRARFHKKKKTFSSPETAEEMSEGSANAFSLARRAKRRCPASLSQQQAATTTTTTRARI